MSTEAEQVLREASAAYDGFGFDQFQALASDENVRDIPAPSGTRYTFELTVTDISRDHDDRDRVELEFRVTARTESGGTGESMASERWLERGEIWTGELGELRVCASGGYGWLALGCLLLLAVGAYLYVRYT